MTYALERPLDPPEPQTLERWMLVEAERAITDDLQLYRGRKYGAEIATRMGLEPSAWTDKFLEHMASHEYASAISMLRDKYNDAKKSLAGEIA